MTLSMSALSVSSVPQCCDQEWAANENRTPASRADRERKRGLIIELHVDEEVNFSVPGLGDNLDEVFCSQQACCFVTRDS